MKKFILFFLLCMAISSPAEIDPGKCRIITPGKSRPTADLAAKELQKHLLLICGTEIPIEQAPGNENFNFYIGTRNDNDKTPLMPEEARYTITPNAIYIYGDDEENSPLNPLKTGRTGTLSAVYCFLENEFGIRWIEPGDAGIVFSPCKNFDFREKKFSWTPQLTRRIIRSGISPYEKITQDMPEKLKPNSKKYREYARDVETWLKRMRMGHSLKLSYGHAFTGWWSKYGKTHPEYFALTEKGKREPLNPEKPFAVKMCVSNPGLYKAIAREWQMKSASFNIRACENDGYGYCTCPECRKLDAETSGDMVHDSFTDRYVFFANAILAEAKKINPDAKAVMYAYSNYEKPPEHQRLDPDVIIGYVPSMFYDFSYTDSQFKLWRKAGAKDIFLRPNDQHCNTGLPGGFEKRMFDAFQIGVKNNIFGTDYDCLHNFWPVNGISDYILARAHTDPSKTFEYWEDEYCSCWGPAKNEVKEFFGYWRNVFEQRFMPDKEKILETGRLGDYRRAFMNNLEKYYSLDDFDKTDSILAKGLSKQLSSSERERLEKLILANTHSRLTFIATVSEGNAKSEAARKLLNFRIKYADILNIYWPGLTAMEKRFGDTTGIQTVEQLKDFNNFAETPLYWFFKLDPQNIGLQEKWQETEAEIITKWDIIRTNSPWENPGKHSAEELKEKLAAYDGIGWYAVLLKIDKSWQGKEIFLYFGAVDESCQVYVNGKFAGERIHKKSDDWKTPFTIRITPQIDWTREKQNIIVRVEDTGGNGGIWQNVWLTCK